MRVLTVCVCLFTLVQTFAQEAWTQLNDFPNASCCGSSFELLNETYVVIPVSEEEYAVYRYEVASDNFSFAFDLPSSFNAPFVINDQIYGVDLSGDESVNVWMYDPILDDLIQKNDAVTSFFTFGSFNPLSWVIDGKAFLGLPGNTESASMLEYDEINDVWLQRAPSPSGFDQLVSSFSFNGKAYTIFGSSDLGSEPSYPNMWEYDPVEDSWEEKVSFPDLGRLGSAIFAIGEYVYVGVGAIFLSIAEKSFYRYNLNDDSWQVIENPNHFSIAPFSFSIGEFGYFGGGYAFDESTQSEQNLSSVYRLDPEFLSTRDVSDPALALYPNPAENVLHIKNLPSNATLTIFDVLGKELSIDLNNTNKINVSNVASGLYFLNVVTPAGKEVLKFIKK